MVLTVGMVDKTTIEISKEVRKDLRVWKAEREMTYDEAIAKLLEEA